MGILVKTTLSAENLQVQLNDVVHVASINVVTNLMLVEKPAYTLLGNITSMTAVAQDWQLTDLLDTPTVPQQTYAIVSDSLGALNKIDLHNFVPIMLDTTTPTVVGDVPTDIGNSKPLDINTLYHVILTIDLTSTGNISDIDITLSLPMGATWALADPSGEFPPGGPAGLDPGTGIKHVTGWVLTAGTAGNIQVQLSKTGAGTVTVNVLVAQIQRSL